MILVHCCTLQIESINNILTFIRVITYTLVHLHQQKPVLWIDSTLASNLGFISSTKFKCCQDLLVICWKVFSTSGDIPEVLPGSAANPQRSSPHIADVRRHQLIALREEPHASDLRWSQDLGNSHSSQVQQRHDATCIERYIQLHSSATSVVNQLP